MTRFRPPPEPDVTATPGHGKVLVIAPHPDDETMGMGGTMALHRRQDDPVTVCFVCSGVMGDPDGYFEGQSLEELRQKEARDACAVLGVEDLRFWGYPDNLTEADFGDVFENLPDDPDQQRQALVNGFATRIADLIDAEGFDIVYHPWEQELNGDHWAAGQAVIVLKSSRPDLADRVAFMGYDVWSPLIAETVIDTSEVIETKLEAARCYESQLLYRDYIPAVLGLDAYRSLFLERGAVYGEAFTGRYQKKGES